MTGERAKTLLCAALLALAAFLAWGNSLDASFQFDDHPSIIENEGLRDLTDIRALLNPPVTASQYGRPLPNVTFAVNYALGGTDPWGYHAVNLALHLFAALALFGLCRRLLRQGRVSGGLGDHATGLSLAVALLWLLHPLQTAAVTYIAQRIEVLASLFYLLALYALVRSDAQSGREKLWQGVALAATLAAFASKESTASLPLAALLCDRAFLSGSFAGAWKKRKRFYAALFACWLLLLALAASSGTRGGTVFVASHYGPLEYLRVQAFALVTYLKLALWPAPLVFDYGAVEVPGWGRAAAYGLPLLALLAATLHGLRKNHPAAFCGTLFFALLAPTSSIIPIRDALNLHRMYLPLAPLVALAVLGAARLALKGRGLGASPWPVYVAALLLAPALGVAAFARNRDYATEYALWSDTLAKRPENHRAAKNLGLILLGERKYALAEERLSRAMEEGEADQLTLLGLGAARLGQGKVAQAVESLRQAKELMPGDIHINFELALALLRGGDGAGASECLADAARGDGMTPAMAGRMARRLALEGFGDAAMYFARRCLALAAGAGDGRKRAEFARLLDELSGEGRPK